MEYKMIVLDLDDTLLLDNGKISEENKKTLNMAQEKGVKIVLASGRPTFGVKRIAEELELEKYEGFILSYNGGRIIDCKTKEVLFETHLTKEQKEKLFELSKKYETFIHTYDEENILANGDNPYSYIESEITNMPLKIVDNFLDDTPENCIKAVFLQTPEHLKEVEEILKPSMKDEMSMTITKPYFLEFMNKDVDKGKSIKRLCDILGIDISEVIAIGDSYNDISMIQTVGFGVAMGNAVEEVKNIAKFITDTNENDGVAKVVKQFVLNK